MSTNCIYCEENNSSEHFCCEICGVGMCEDCYNNEEEHSRHYQEITDSCESNEEVNRILDACNNKEPDYLCQCCLAKILGDEVIEVKKFSAWKIVEKRNYVANDKNHYSCYWDLCNGEMIIKSYGKLKYADSDFEAIKKYETPKDIVVSLIKAIIRSLDVFGCAQFSYEDQFFDIFESSEGGYEYSIYPNDLDLIFEDGELIDEEEIDGGLCTGDEKDVLSFIFPEHLLYTSVDVVESIEITANKTIDVLSSGLAYYNYQGNHFRLFASKNDALRYVESKDESLIVKEFSNEGELDTFLSDPSMH